MQTWRRATEYGLHWVLQVLRAIDEDGLQHNSLEVGAHLMHRLHALKDKHDIIGDVRGKGLMVGVELVKDRATKVSQNLARNSKGGFED